MTHVKKVKNKDNLIRRAAAYSTGQIADQAAYQSFTFLVFTFYFAVVQLNIVLITVGFIIWALWNSFNDPMLGYLSDRTHTKYGRRMPYIITALVPLGIVSFLLFTPPLPIGIANQVGNFIYFLITIILFELFYTMYSLNATSLFPETFITKDERTTANNVRQVFLIVGLIVAFILPGLFIEDYSNFSTKTLREYQLFGIELAIIIIIFAAFFALFTPREKPEFREDYKNAPNFFNTIKMCVKSRSFAWFIPVIIANWFVYGILPTLVPIYAKAVLHMDDAFMISILLGFTFISSAIFITILWKPVVRKLGNRNAWIISMTSWILTLLPLMFLGPNMEVLAMIVFFFIGLGLSGSLYITDLVIADIIDEDEVNTGTRREAGYYGVNAFFLRFAIIVVFLSIGPVFIIADWPVFTYPVTYEVELGLRILMFGYPAVALIIAIIAISKFPLHGERLIKVKEALQKLHQEKKSKI
ncbi:MAG: MFS transporter [Candidatus Lokiarchaeia archaeon]|nr:MFS transporter [Candidatus Lokiarchaeia archaeon]